MSSDHSYHSGMERMRGEGGGEGRYEGKRRLVRLFLRESEKQRVTLVSFPSSPSSLLSPSATETTPTNQHTMTHPNNKGPF